MIQSQNENAQLWFANLQLKFEQSGGRTILKHRKHQGPVRVQKMLWPEKTGVCHSILVHPPAGIAGGDHLTFDFGCGAFAHALVTTPGAGKWYKTNLRQAFQHIYLSVEDHGILEWLPQETMLFNGAFARAETNVNLTEHAAFIGWDMLVIGRQARLEKFDQGHYHSEFQLKRNDKLLVHDVLSFHGQDRFLTSMLGMNNCAVMGMLWAVAPSTARQTHLLDEVLEQLRALISRMQMPIYMTRLDDVLSARYLGEDARQCHDGFAAIRAKLRKIWWDLDEEYPRIWRT